MSERNTQSDIEDNLYTEATKEANEILFGSQTSPEKPWPEKVVSKRKKLVLQLIDQKLKFKLIKLMSQFGEQNQRKASSSYHQISHSHKVDLAASIDGRPSLSVKSQCRYNAFEWKPPMNEVNGIARPNFNSIYPHHIDAGTIALNNLTSTGEVNFVQQHKYAIDPIYRQSTDLSRNVSTECTTNWLHPKFRPSTTNHGDLRNQLMEKQLKRKPSQRNFQGKFYSKEAKHSNEDEDEVSFETISVEWNKMKSLFTKISRSRFMDITIADYDFKVAMLFEMSIDPDALRSNRLFTKKLFDEEVERFIDECKNILSELNGADSDVQSNFYALRDKMILDIIRSSHVDNDAENYQLILRKIRSVIDPLLYSHKLSKLEERERKDLVIELIKNPHTLESTENVNPKIVAQKGSVENVMREIKCILDEHIVVRRPKNFHFPKSKYFDIPFVVHLTDKSGEMNEVHAAALRDALLNLIDLEKTQFSIQKPKILNIKFSSGILIITCANRLTFDWIEKTATTVNFHGRWSNAKFNVDFVGVNSVIPINNLKTIFAKFSDPQFRHFNYLMVQLKLDNPSLLTERWELRGLRGINMDSPNEMYIGVDVESLINMEKNNRVAFVGKSMVSFDICYDENVEHFELIPRKRKINKICF